MSKWVPMQEALELIVEKRLSDFEYLAACKFASKEMIEKLGTGELCSRPKNPEDFSLFFHVGADAERIPTQPDGTIPALFWTFWKEAEELTSPLLVDEEIGDFAQCLGGEFIFRRTGLRNDGILEGKVSGVELLRDQLPGGLPRPKGRPRKQVFDNHHIVKRAKQAILLGRPKSKVIDRFAILWNGKGCHESKKSQLRKALRKCAGTDLK